MRTALSVATIVLAVGTKASRQSFHIHAVDPFIGGHSSRALLRPYDLLERDSL